MSKRPKKKPKPAAELTDSEAIARLFPKPVRERANQEAEKAKTREKKPHSPKDT